MSDLIRREDVLKFPIRLDHYDEEHGSREYVLGIESVMDYVESLPSAPRWIPVTERLPEPYEVVLISDKEEVYVGEVGECGEWKTCYYEFLMDVDAWMPLPEPWKGESDE